MTLQSASILEGWRNNRDNLTVNDYRLILADLEALQANGDGDVVGPAISVDQEIVVMDGTTGKLIAGSGVTISQLLANIFSGALQVDAATTAALTGTWTYNNLGGVGDTLTKTTNGAFQTVDTVVSAVGKTYLFKNQVDQLTNGKWELTTQGTAGTPTVFTRSTDSDTAVEFDAQIILVGGGSLAGNLRKVFSQTTPLPTPGTNNIVYGSSSAAGLGIPLTRTVAQMQALASGATITRGRGYYVTGIALALGVTCDAFFVGTSTTTISITGWCPAFENLVTAVAVPVEIKYELATDTITEIYAPATRVRITASAGQTSGVDSWPFDSTTIVDTFALVPGSLSIHVATIMSGCNFGWGTSITTATGTTLNGQSLGTGAGITLAGTAGFNGVIGAGSTYSGVGSSTFSGNIGAGATVSLDGTQSLTNCTIGDGKTADFTGVVSSYTAVGKVYIGDMSTFEITSADSAAVNPDVTNTIDMATFLWAGVLRCDDGTNMLNDFINFPTDHEWIIEPAVGAGIDIEDRTTAAAGNIWFNTIAVNATTLTGDDLELMVFMAARNSPTQVVVKYFTITI